MLVVEVHLGAVVVDIFNLLEKHRIHSDIVTMSCDERHHLFGNLLHLVVVHAFHHVEKHAADLAEQLARLIVSPDGVFEIRSLGIVAYRRNFRHMLLHSFDESRHIMLVFNLIERWRLKICAIIREKWIVVAIL